MLRNGLTLELFYSAGFDEGERPAAEPTPGHRPELSTSASQGVWMLREEVLLEVKVGVA